MRGLRHAHRLRQRAAGQRHHHADRASGEQRRHDPTPRDQQRQRRGAEQYELPGLRELPGERDRGAEDRADRGRPGPAEERPRAAVGAQPLEMAAPSRIRAKDGTNATTAARIAPPRPWAA